jgi:hypothetical protein
MRTQQLIRELLHVPGGLVFYELSDDGGAFKLGLPNAGDTGLGDDFLQTGLTAAGHGSP